MNKKILIILGIVFVMGFYLVFANGNFAVINNKDYSLAE